MALIAENFISSPHCYSEAIEKLRAKLVTLASSIAPRTGVYITSIDGFKIARSICPTEITPSFYKPSASFFIQGAKTIKINKSTYACNSPSCLIVSASLPALSRIVSASSDAPYISLHIDLDINEMLSICSAWPKQNQLYQVPRSAVGFEDINEKMYDALFRLICTLENPRDMKALAPLLLREITFRLLQGSHGFQLREIARHNSQLQRINHAITSLVNNYNAPLNPEYLANLTGKSLRAFNHRFQMITGMSPLDFQNQLRLHQARQLIIFGGVDVFTASRFTGYDSHLIFTQEYTRLFNSSPFSDERLYKAADVLVGED